MMRSLLRSRAFVGLLCAVLLTIEAARHLLFLVGVLSYQALWGVSTKVTPAVTGGEAISLVLLLVFDVAVIVLMRHRYIRVVRTTSGRRKRRFFRTPVIARVTCRVATIAMVLFFIGYLRAGTLGLRVGMGIYTAVLTALLIWFQLLIAGAEHRAWQHFVKIKKHQMRHGRRLKKSEKRAKKMK